ncbi:hypothetical protein M6B38_229140 [Iris pallida]|uniref:Uncharacterized protein n=1 Tax=Iris pallida TaxID=29817 RepID=A0AAX6DU45_IRIPA|nr:hypothetical protein M6B38_229140 [Iris pallida]
MVSNSLDVKSCPTLSITPILDLSQFCMLCRVRPWEVLDTGSVGVMYRVSHSSVSCRAF